MQIAKLCIHKTHYLLTKIYLLQYLPTYYLNLLISIYLSKLMQYLPNQLLKTAKKFLILILFLDFSSKLLKNCPPQKFFPTAEKSQTATISHPGQYGIVGGILLELFSLQMALVMTTSEISKRPLTPFCYQNKTSSETEQNK